jgi:hypothetical protein
MSTHPIPEGVDPIILGRAIALRLLRPDGWTFAYEQEGENPTAVEFIHDLDGVEERALQTIFAYAKGFPGLETPPDWANWTYQQAETHIKGAILDGKSQAEVDAQIDALPSTVAGMRAGLHQVAGALVAIRTILAAMSKAFVYLRNLIIRLRD